jgi:VWFA-related protein
MKPLRASLFGLCVPRLLLPLALIALATGVGVAEAQEQPSLEVIVQQADDAGYPNVRLVGSITDNADRPLTGLGADDFRVTAGDVELPLNDVQAVLDTDVGIGIVLSMDVSGSMEGQPLDRAREVSSQFVQQLSPSDTVALAAFSDEVTVTQPFTSDTAAAIAAVESLTAGGDTSLYNAVAEVSDLVRQSDQPRRAVLFLSDGLDTGPQTSITREESIEAARASGVPFFVVGLGTETDVAYLKELAEVTNARFYQAPSPDALRELFDAVAALLRTQYVLQIDASEMPSDALSLTLMAESRGRSGSGDYTLPQDFFRPRVSLPGLPTEAITAPLSLRPQISARYEVTAVQYSIDGQPLRGADAAPFELLLDPIDHAAGQHELKVVVTDVNGLEGEAEGAVQIASIPPRVEIVNAQDGTVIRGSWSPELEIKSQAPLASVEVLLDGKPLNADQQGRFHLDSAVLGEGSHRLVVRAADEAGGVTETPALTLDLRHPTGGGGRLVLGLVALGLAVVVSLAVLWYWRRKRRRGPPIGAITPPPAPAPQFTSMANSGSESASFVRTRARQARLTLADGDGAEWVFPVAEEPVTIGSDPGCTIVLPGDNGRVAPREARVWLREEKFMLHRLPRRSAAASSDRQPVWAVLEHGDEIWVGSCRFVFEILSA